MAVVVVSGCEGITGGDGGGGKTRRGSATAQKKAMRARNGPCFGGNAGNFSSWCCHLPAMDRCATEAAAVVKEVGGHGLWDLRRGRNGHDDAGNTDDGRATEAGTTEGAQSSPHK